MSPTAPSTAPIALALLTLPWPGAPADDPVPRWGERLEWAAEDGPQAREHAAFALDAARDRAVLLLGSGYEPYGTPLADAWALDLESGAWTELPLLGDELTPGGSRRLAPADGGAYVFGGYGAGMTPGNELWRLEYGEDHIGVQALTQVHPPPARALHAFACDPAGERFVVFGGASEAHLGDLWLGELSEGAVHWRAVEQDPEASPGPRFGFAYAHDAARERLLVCGGQVPATGQEEGGLPTARDLWALDLGPQERGWELLAEYAPDELPGRRNPAFAFDPARGDLLVWGGTGDGTGPLSDLYVVHTREPDAPVERLEQPAGVPARASSFGLVDPGRRRAYLGFGNSALGVFRDLVEVHLKGPAGRAREAAAGATEGASEGR